jgi:hypothetical protein
MPSLRSVSFAMLCGAMTIALALSLLAMRSQSDRAIEYGRLGAPSVAIELRTSDGVAQLHAFGRDAYTIDPRLLSFVFRRHGASDATFAPMAATIADAHLLPRQSSGGLQEYIMDVRFARPDAAGGLYDVQLVAADGFARDDRGAELPLGDWSRPEPQGHVVVWWPPADDGSLQRIRDELVGKDVYGFGGITIGCQPRSFSDYDAVTPVHVRGVERDRGKVEHLWTGSTVQWGNDLAPNFFAVEPLRILVDMPANAKPFVFGGTSSPAAGECPAIVLADWQVDVTLSLGPPPPSVPHNVHGYGKVEIGMTRRDVVWRHGYPTQYGGAADLDRLSTWTYSADNSPTITFRNDRVSGYGAESTR